MSPSTDASQEYLDKLHSYLRDFFRTSINAPDDEGIMVAKDTVFELLCKVCLIKILLTYAPAYILLRINNNGSITLFIVQIERDALWH